jgi:hypothetical protein
MELYKLDEEAYAVAKIQELSNMNLVDLVVTRYAWDKNFPSCLIFWIVISFMSILLVVWYFKSQRSRKRMKFWLVWENVGIFPNQSTYDHLPGII